MNATLLAGGTVQERRRAGRFRQMDRESTRDAGDERRHVMIGAVLKRVGERAVPPIEVVVRGHQQARLRRARFAEPDEQRRRKRPRADDWLGPPRVEIREMPKSLPQTTP